MRLTSKQSDALQTIAQGRFYPTFVREEDGWHARWRSLDGGENAWIDEYVREATLTRLSEDAEDQRHETLHDAWMMALRSQTGLVRWNEAECVQFAADLAAWSGSATEDGTARAATRFAFQPPELTCARPKGRAALRVLGQAVAVYPALAGLRRKGELLALTLTPAEADAFVEVGARTLIDAGYGVDMPDFAVRVSVTAELHADESAATPSLAKADFVVRVAGERVTADEIRFLLEQGHSLVFFRDRWIHVNRSILKEALRVLERLNGKPVAHPLAFALGLSRVTQLEIDELKAHGWVRGLVNELRQRGEALVPTLDFSRFQGTLRDYQTRGVAWLTFMARHGFGALLADDMGLGKTIQTIGWVLNLPPAPEKGPVLIVAPLTLLTNWQREFARFAPSLRVFLHQGKERVSTIGFSREFRAADVVLTSYNLLIHDYSGFSSLAWRALVLDEAQAIKNPDSRTAMAVRSLAPEMRLALTGTPIENSLLDVWSIEEFLNPGFLGDRHSFLTRFPVRKLSRALEPFVLRRLKSDPAVAVEIGEKRIIREYCPLDREQRAAYERELMEFRLRERKQGEVFALITALKLICDGSGKLARLCDLLEAIFDSGESALIFTQYVKVGQWLREELARKFGANMPFLHGGLTVAQRERQIRLFNLTGPRAFILSLKAGGFGLNLTKATHVIHFDRWWNPAVESQATDRAHRMGQEKDVFVHNFITTGTIEEHVEDILARKTLTASSVLTSAEWLAAAELT